MNSMVRPRRSCRSRSRLTICAWIDTSSAETGSSATMNSGSSDQRTGDADALALAAGEFMRVAIDRIGRQLDRRQRRPRLGRAARGRCRCPGSPGLRSGSRRSSCAATGWRRGPGRYTACAAAAGASRAPDSLVSSCAVEHDLAGGRLDQPQHGPADRGLARAGFADQPDHLAAADLEGDVVERAHHRAAAEGAGAEMLGQAARRRAAVRPWSDLLPSDAAAGVAGADLGRAPAPPRGRPRSHAGSGWRRRSRAACSAGSGTVPGMVGQLLPRRLQPRRLAQLRHRGAAGRSCRGGAGGGTPRAPARSRRSGRHTSPPRDGRSRRPRRDCG